MSGRANGGKRHAGYRRLRQTRREHPQLSNVCFGQAVALLAFAVRRSAFLEAVTNLSLLRGCHPITLFFAASIPFDNFENQQQDKATDTGPNKPNIGVRPTEQNISVRNIGAHPSIDAFDQVVPTGPPRHDYLPWFRAVMTEVGDSDKSRRAFATPTVVCAASEWRIPKRGGWLKLLLTFA